MLKSAVIITLVGVALGLPTNSSAPDTAPAPRIVGGHETDIEHNPWTLALLYYRQHFCGDVEIHAQWALTAAHCLEGVEVINLSVRAGSTTKSSGGQIVDVVRTYNHPEYNRRTADYDFAPAGTRRTHHGTNRCSCCPTGTNAQVVEGQTAVIAGWGRLSSEGVTPEILHMVELPVVGYELCQRGHPNNQFTDRMFCTGDIEQGGKDACAGDGEVRSSWRVDSPALCLGEANALSLECLESTLGFPSSLTGFILPVAYKLMGY
ncbi:hypothetical protein NQ318_000258 [Aromia moschata]|uniref:Peptidase S1 domain-containing protein n=1 Tax=Aromia moschata TaxID=1265417 RepID=A0AAV8YTA2_9CUCU|nr:hypothetical protein NQ318_000258 [Aromia moschata]